MTDLIGISKIRQLLPQIESEHFSRDIFEKMGIFVIRRAIPGEIVSLWQSAWGEFYKSEFSDGRAVNPFNPVAVDKNPPPVLENIHRNPALLDIIEQAFGPDLALYNQRFVIKDCHSRGSVFLHNDFCYHFGWPTKASAFVALSPMTAENGGMVFYPGTHQYGYLGDAGQLNPDFLDPAWPSICPSLEPGDVALMNSSTWHRSEPHTGGPDRILVDIIYQPANDPSGIELLRGQWRTEIFLPLEARGKVFSNSRAIRLQQMRQRLEEFEAARESA